VREMFDLADGDDERQEGRLVNIGGVLLIRDDAPRTRRATLLMLTEGFPTYGGLAGRDLDAMARASRRSCTRTTSATASARPPTSATQLAAGGVPSCSRSAGTPIYIDAGRLLPAHPRSSSRARRSRSRSTRHGGIRGCEIGSVMFGDKAVMELVRLAIPAARTRSRTSTT
jgi:tryptophanase